MDDIASVPKVQLSVGHREDSRDRSAGVTLRVLEINTLEKVREIGEKYNALNIPKQDHRMFLMHLTQDRNAWFLEIVEDGQEVGLLYFTNVIPHLSAQMNVLFWDGRLIKARVHTVRQALKIAQREFKLERIGCQIKWSNAALKRFLRDVGMVYEGTLRKGWVDGDGCHDLLLFGVIKEEL